MDVGCCNLIIYNMLEQCNSDVLGLSLDVSFSTGPYRSIQTNSHI